MSDEKTAASLKTAIGIFNEKKGKTKTIKTKNVLRIWLRHVREIVVERGRCISRRVRHRNYHSCYTAYEEHRVPNEFENTKRNERAAIVLMLITRLYTIGRAAGISTRCRVRRRDVRLIESRSRDRQEQRSPNETQRLQGIVFQLRQRTQTNPCHDIAVYNNTSSRTHPSTFLRQTRKYRSPKYNK